MATQRTQSLRQRLRFYSKLAVLYALTICFVGYIAQPLLSFGQAHAAAITRPQLSQRMPAPKIQVIAGLPIRIVIPASGVDLPVDQGYYDAASDSWTLSGYHAQFAMISALANNYSGETFIYGHNNNYVFGALRHVTPARGTTALLYTANGHVFAYSFQSAESLGPSASNILDYSGPPVMLIQTCTGSLNEWRTMYRFDFTKVVQ